MRPMLREMLPFWVSIAILSLLQGAVVALPRAGLPPGSRARRLSPAWQARLDRLGAGARALIPPASVVVFVLVAQAAAHASADTLTYPALVGVPLLAALALGSLMAGAPPGHALFRLPPLPPSPCGRGGLGGPRCSRLS